MKKLISLSAVFIWFGICSTSLVNARGVGINSNNAVADPSALLDLSSTNKGTLITRMTTAQRDAIVNPAEGLQIYNLDCHNYNYYNGTAWVAVNPIIANVSIAASPSGAVCSGTNVTFTATPLNGGSLPTYQWQLNGTASGTNSTVFSFTPSNGDIVTCVMTSNSSCGVIGSPASSNSIAMFVNPGLSASVSIAASSNPTCSGSSVTFTATPTNGGSTPFYQWTLNSVNVGTNSPIYTDASLANGTVITCIVTSNAGPCLTGSPATSNSITVVVNGGGPGTITFGYTGVMQTWQVPPCVSSVTLDVYGAQGMNSAYGGNGGEAKGTLAVTPLQNLYVFVGHSGNSGNWNGGGTGGNYGGDASDVRNGGTALANRVIVGGGGGGAGFDNIGNFYSGGSGGGSTAGTGVGGSSGGSGGAQSSGGAAGISNFSIPGSAGSIGLGGSSGGSYSGANAGGGGGGYYGGGGGLNADIVGGHYFGYGGGGSNYLGPGVTLITNSSGVQSGNGQVIITW